MYFFKKIGIKSKSLKLISITVIYVCDKYIDITGESSTPTFCVWTDICKIHVHGNHYNSSPLVPCKENTPTSGLTV